MLTMNLYNATAQRGATMLEVLITLIIISIGLLGLAGMQARVQTLEMESYQRAQAVLLAKDMAARIDANSTNAASYVMPAGVSSYGTGDGVAVDADCSVLATVAARDVCEWSKTLKGAAESLSGSKVGAMIGARGCVEEVVAPDPSPGVCRPGVYRVTVAWQGLAAVARPYFLCGAGSYGADDAVRRAIGLDMSVGLPRCG